MVGGCDKGVALGGIVVLAGVSCSEAPESWVSPSNWSVVVVPSRAAIQASYAPTSTATRFFLQFHSYISSGYTVRGSQLGYLLDKSIPCEIVALSSTGQALDDHGVTGGGGLQDGAQTGLEDGIVGPSVVAYRFEGSGHG